MKTLSITTNDTVIVLKGKNKGKTGKVIQTFPQLQKIVVEGINTITKHIRPRKKGEKGQRITLFGPIHRARVALWCPQCKKGSRARVRFENNTKTRHCHRCDTVFPQTTLKP